MSQKSTKRKYEPSDIVAAGKAIIYYKNYREMCGSVNSAVLFNQLEFRFYSTGGKPFYKYLSPLKEEINGYKKGDSWTEELGFSESEFRTAFGKMGIAYKCKKDYDRARNKFKGIKTLHKIRNKKKIVEKVEFEAMFCSYHNKRSGQTFYFRNHELITSNLEKLREQVKNNPYESKIGISVNKETKSIEMDAPYPEYTDNTSDKTRELYLYYRDKKPCFLWNTSEGEKEFLDNEDRTMRGLVFINKNVTEDEKFIDDRKTIDIQISKKKIETLVDRCIEDHFSQINESWQTLGENEKQREAVRKLLANPKVGYHGIISLVMKLKKVQKIIENGFAVYDKILEYPDTPVKVQNHYKRIWLDYKKLIASDDYQEWRDKQAILQEWEE
jgi:ribosomal protein L32E